MAGNSGLRVLREAIKQNKFAPVYYVVGEDEFQKDDAVKQLIRAAVDPATKDFNLEIRKADLDARAFDSLLNALPMMADRRVLIIRDVNLLKKEPRKVLDAYMQAPAAENIVVLVSGTEAKVDKILMNSATPLEFPALSADRIPKWIVHYAATELGTSVSAAAADLLHTAVGADLQQLVCELEKLSSYTAGSEITEEAVSEIVGARVGEMLPDLLDAVAIRDGVRAQSLVGRVLAQPKTSGVQLVMALGTQTLAIAWGIARMTNSSREQRSSVDFWGLLKSSGSVFTGRSWSSAVDAWNRALKIWTADDAARALDALVEADVALKESRLSSEEQVIANLVYRMCVDELVRSAA
jgi:DNA polymerase-3 subunit delta